MTGFGCSVDNNAMGPYFGNVIKLFFRKIQEVTQLPSQNGQVFQEWKNR